MSCGTRGPIQCGGSPVNELELGSSPKLGTGPAKNVSGIWYIAGLLDVPLADGFDSGVVRPGLAVGGWLVARFRAAAKSAVRVLRSSRFFALTASLSPFFALRTLLRAS